MKKALIITAIIVALILGMSTFSYYYENSHPTKYDESYKIPSPIDAAKDRADSLERVIRYQQEFEELKERKRIKDSIEAMKIQKELIEERLYNLRTGRNGYDEGYEDGYEEGYSSGYQEAEQDLEE